MVIVPIAAQSHTSYDNLGKRANRRMGISGGGVNLPESKSHLTNYRARYYSQYIVRGTLTVYEPIRKSWFIYMVFTILMFDTLENIDGATNDVVTARL